MRQPALVQQQPGAQFGVGVSSAAGFDAAGNPFFTHEGGPDAASAASSEDLLKAWRPFGVRNALYFLITGRESDTVKLVSKADLRVREQA